MRRSLIPESPDAAVDMTPMLDIVFILLIFFIVASTLVRETGLDVTQNQKKNDAEQPSNASAIYVQLCDQHNVFVDQRPIDIRALRSNIEAKMAVQPNSFIILETRESAPTSLLVTAMDQAMATKANVTVAEQYAVCAGGQS